MKIGLVVPVKLSHPYSKNDPAPPLDLHHPRISLSRATSASSEAITYCWQVYPWWRATSLASP